MESFHNLEQSLFFEIFLLAWKHSFLEQKDVLVSRWNEGFDPLQVALARLFAQDSA